MKHNAPPPPNEGTASTAASLPQAAHTQADGTAALRTLLRQAAGAEPPAASPGFRPAVWARIEALHTAPATWAQWLRGHALGVGVACVVCVLLAGIGGSLLARQQVASERRAQFQRYMVSIDAHHRLAFEADRHHSPQ